MYLYSVSCPKYTPPFSTLLSGKSGKGVFILKSQLVVCIHPSLHPVSYNVTHKIDNHDDLLRLSGRMAALLNMYYRNSAVLVLIL